MKLLHRAGNLVLLVVILLTLGWFVDRITQLQGLEKTLVRIAASGIALACMAGFIVAIEWIFGRCLLLLGLHHDLMVFLWRRAQERRRVQQQAESEDQDDQ